MKPSRRAATGAALLAAAVLAPQGAAHAAGTVTAT